MTRAEHVAKALFHLQQADRTPDTNEKTLHLRAALVWATLAGCCD